MTHYLAEIVAVIALAIMFTAVACAMASLLMGTWTAYHSWKVRRRAQAKRDAGPNYFVDYSIVFAAVSLLMFSGCTRTLTYDRTADGGEHFTYSNTGFDTHIGKLTIDKTERGVAVGVENLDSQARAMDLAARALDVLGAAAVKAVAP